MSKKTAIIPVAGAGTRLRPLTYTQPKSLIPVAGKPIISYIIDDLKQAGVEDFVFVIGYFGEKIVDYVKEHEKDIHADFVHQPHREGLGHAIYLASEAIKGNREVIIALGDSLIEVDHDFFNSKSNAIAIKKVKDPVNFGVAEFDDDNKLVRLVEKPKFPKSNEALVGWYKIKDSEKLFKILEKYNRENIRTNGEIQLTDALNEMLQEHIEFQTYTVKQWLDVGNGDILLKSNEILLKKHGSSVSKKIVNENSIIIEPVSIADNCKLVNSIVGPNVTIGEHTVIDNSILEDGIIGSYSRITKMKLQEFVIGSDSVIQGLSQSISVGDNTELNFSK